jgi:hypothetical protein
LLDRLIAIRRLMRAGDMLESCSELAVREPELMRLVLQGEVAAIVNTQSVKAVSVELNQRAVRKNRPTPGAHAGRVQ